MNELKEKKYNYSSLNDYLQFIRENLKPIKTIRTGTFISQNYLFFLNLFKKKYPEKKKDLDFFPIDLIIYNSPTKKSFVCLNWHALPVPTRQILLARLRKQFEASFREDKQSTFIPGMNYKKLLRYLKKIGVGIRRYTYSRVRKLAIIAPNQLDEIMKFRSLTWYKTNYAGIVSKYNNYR